MSGTILSGIIYYFIISAFIAWLPIEAHINKEYRTEREDYGGFAVNDFEINNRLSVGEMNGHEVKEVDEIHLITKKSEQPQKFTYPLNIGYFPPDDVLSQTWPISLNNLKALEYINAHPDPGKHDESRRVKRV